jgi:5-(carboxyamino)imidazole ribonucleotide synthase
VSFPVVGVVGGGQLARMMQPPAVALGVRLRLLATDPGESAAQVIPDVVLGHHTDLDALRRFAAGCDVVTFDHEHVPPEHLRALEDDGVAVRPGPGALVHAQDKGVMREALTKAGVPCPRWALVREEAELAEFGDAVGWPVVLKTVRGGYDGKGVRVIASAAEAHDWLSRVPHTGHPLLAEEKVAFTRELAALVARSPHGQVVAYPVVETLQIDGVCREVVAPARIADEHAVAAQEAALRIAGELGVTGILAVEMFDTADGVLVNELAMRPHNSGHWSIDGAVTSQFENHLRAVLDLPLGSPEAVAPATVMVNVLGGDYPEMYPAYRHVMARDPGLKVHLYGKDVKPGRKVGHVNVLGDDVEDLLERGRHAAAYLRGEITE